MKLWVALCAFSAFCAGQSVATRSAPAIACTPAPAATSVAVAYDNAGKAAYAAIPDVPVSIGATGRAHFISVGMDTGSVGLAVHVATFYRMMGFEPPPRPRDWPIETFPSPLPPGVSGPGPVGRITYTSSGNVEIGNWWMAPLTFGTRGAAMTIPTRILVVTQLGCDPKYSRHRCGPPRPAYFGSNMGVGFADVFDGYPPSDNPFLQLHAMVAGALPRRYILTSRDVRFGGTAADLAGFDWIKLDRSSAIAGDWDLAPGCIRFPQDPTIATACGRIKVDTGLPPMLVALSSDRQWGSVASYIDAGKSIEIVAPALDGSKALDWSFAPHPKPAYPAAVPPAIRLLEPRSVAFVNTGTRILYAYDYAYDADCGAIGFRPASP